MQPPVRLKQPSPEEFRDRFLHYLRYSCGIEMKFARAADHLEALALAVRESIIDRTILTRRDLRPGPAQDRQLPVGGVPARPADAQQPDRDRPARDRARGDAADRPQPGHHHRARSTTPGLGTGGLGRLAACFLDSLATLDYPAYGYGLRYDYGMFRQNFDDGWQVEHPDDWLAEGNAWEIERPDLAVPVMIGGHVEWDRDELGGHHPRWAGQRTFYGVPYDMLVAGYDTLTVATLRLWTASRAGRVRLPRSSPRATTCQRGGRAGAHRGDHPGALPRRPRRGRARAPAAAGVLPGRLLGARRRASASGAATARSGSCSRTRWRSSSTTPTRP